MNPNYFEILKTRLLSVLEKIYDKRESYNIADIYFKDRWNFNIHSYPDISGDIIETFESDLKRFATGEPVQYITGKAWFYENLFEVDRNVLIPRPETEELTEMAIKLIMRKNFTTILDIGTGSGCIALSIAKKITNCKIEAIDISESALNIANRNKQTMNIENVVFKELNFLLHNHREKLGNYDMVISNPPYIGINEKDSIGRSTFEFEPHTALFCPDDDRLLFYRMIVDFVLNGHLNPGGLVLSEINEFASEDLKNLLMPYNKYFEISKDMQGKDRFLTINF